MLIYRYEMNDHGGPYFTLDGTQRRTGVRIPTWDFVFGCRSIEDLNSYFKHKEKDYSDCKLAVYNIPENLVRMSDSQVIFNKNIISTYFIGYGE